MKGQYIFSSLLAVFILLSGCSDRKEQKTEKKNAKVEVIKAIPNDSSQSDTESKNEPKQNTQTLVQEEKSAIKPLSVELIDKKSDALEETSEDKLSLKDENRLLTVLDISERSFDGGNAIAVTLSVPLDPAKKYDDYFSLSIKGKGLAEGSSILSKSGKTVYFPFTEPATNYEVTVYKNLAGVNGNVLSENYFSEVKTRDIKATYSFASQGSFLSLKQHTGIPVSVINTPEVNLDYFRVDSDKVALFLNSNSRFQEHIYRYSTRHKLNNAELVYSARYQFDAPKNKRREFNLPVQSIEELAKPGVYIAVMSLPGDFHKNIKMSYFTVTDIGLHVRVYNNQIEAFVTSLENQKPLKGVEIELIDRKGKSLYLTKSSPDGIASVPRKIEDSRYILARLDDSFSIVAMTGPAFDLSDFQLAKRPFRQQELFVYSSRDLYRPGELIDFNGLLRDFDGRAVKNPTLKVSIKQPDGSVAKQFSWYSEAEGFYSHEYQIPTGAKTGTWKLEVNNASESIVSYPFKVEEFLPERMKLTFNKDQEQRFYQPSDKLSISILGEYLYGAPASKNRLEARVTVRPNREPFENLLGFQFGDTNEKYQKDSYKLKDITLNEKGMADLVVENRWTNAKSPIEVSLVGSLFESGGRPVVRKHQTTVLPSGNLIGIKPHFSGNPKQNSRLTFEVITVNSKAELIEAEDLEVRLIKEDRRYFWEYSESRGWHYQWSDKEYTEYNTKLSTSNKQAQKLDISVEYGRYRLEIKDPNSGRKSSLQFHAGRDWYSDWKKNQSGSQAARPDKVSLAWDKEFYKPGDEAQLSIVPPKSGEAILLIEADKPLLMKRITVPKDGVVVTIPIDKNWNRHDIYASVVHLQYGDKEKTITPTRALGLLHLPLNRDNRKLSVDLEVDEKIYPNQSYTTRVKVTGADAKKAYLTLAMVDVGVLSITGYKTPDPHKYYFEPRRFEVDSRDMYQKLIELNGNPLARQKFGGDAELSRGGKKAQSEVQILSLHSRLVNVDENGYADVTFDIPEFNGRVRFMAVAFSENKFGSAEAEMTIAAPLVTQLAMPRFMAVGDSSTLALDLHNLTDKPQKLAVQLIASEPLNLNKTMEIELKVNEKKTLSYPIETNNSDGRSTIKLKVEGVDDYPIDRDWGLNIRSAYPATTLREHKVLSAGESFDIKVDEDAGFMPESIEGVISISNTVDLKLNEQMGNLFRYPYGCLEQTTSRVYPWLYATDDILSSIKQSNNKVHTRSKSISQGIEGIQAKSLGNGSFGLWSNQSREEHWLSVYVADFFTDAREQGVSVSDSVFQQSMKRLQDYLRRKNGTYNNRWSDSEEHYDLAYRAYAGYVLSRHKKAHLSSLRDLADHKASDAYSPLPLIHLAIALSNQGDTKRAVKLLDKAKKTDRIAGYLGDYGSDVRDKAMIINLLIKSGIDLDYAKELSLELAELLKGKTYLSTQERNAVFLAGMNLELNSRTQWQADLLLGDAIKTITHAGSYTNRVTASEINEGIKLSNKQEDTLFVEFKYQGMTANPPAPRSSHLNIERTYFDLKGKEITPEKLKVGDLVLVALKVKSDWRKPDALVIDLLPAGLEIENQNLDHAIKIDDLKVRGKSISDLMKRTNIIHQEYRDDRYVAAIDVRYQRDSFLFYLVRAVTPGVYKVPAPLVEDMYKPEDNAIGKTLEKIEVVNH